MDKRLRRFDKKMFRRVVEDHLILNGIIQVLLNKGILTEDEVDQTIDDSGVVEELNSALAEDANLGMTSLSGFDRKIFRRVVENHLMLYGIFQVLLNKGILTEDEVDQAIDDSGVVEELNAAMARNANLE